ncbi:hypothetical protein HB884_07955 [Listeria booriae]|uniref:YopX family protein n=1 Tax=Listeria booriae TaxID=1552123 RepID=UPI0016277117|nr:YopX family protein [Listeria booriae]MBC1524139.1 hypothetical protein [Listeria booriae]
MKVGWRKIIFRAKKVGSGEWVYGDLIQFSSESACFISQAQEKASEKSVAAEFVYSMVEVEPKSVGEHVGMSETGNEHADVYEDDVVRVRGVGLGDDADFTGVVTHLEGAWMVVNEALEICRPLWSESREIEILGNVFDNPELIQKTYQTTCHFCSKRVYTTSDHYDYKLNGKRVFAHTDCYERKDGLGETL